MGCNSLSPNDFFFVVFVLSFSAACIVTHVPNVRRSNNMLKEVLSFFILTLLLYGDSFLARPDMPLQSASHPD